MRHFESLHQFSVNEITDLLQLADKLKSGYRPLMGQTFAVNLFFEPSTRTKSSFVMAEHKLGMEVLDFQAETSSVKKGETLYDTAKTMEAIGANMLVIRHADDNWMEELSGRLTIPVINAGSGKTEHPTQGLLDLLTIYQEFGTFRGLKIAICGDIIHSRVAHSNAQALKRMGATVYLCAAPGFEDDSLPYPYITIDEAVDECDVIMLLRIQHERHEGHWHIAYYLQDFGMTKDRESRMKNHAIIMHPAPVNRGVEIDSDLVECKRSRIFKQMENGVYARMAIITKMMEEWGMYHAPAFKKYQITANKGTVANM